MLSHYEKIAKIKSFTDVAGKVHGTEDFSIYLYSIIKMTKPQTILELGTGLGITTLWAALAIEENNTGLIHTIDDGSEWETLGQHRDLFMEYHLHNYSEYVNNLLSTFELSHCVSFYNQKISKFDNLNNIDILFCDYSHGPYSIVKFIADYMTKMNTVSYIFIDSASTYYSSFHTLEATIDILNSGKIPLTLVEMIDPAERNQFTAKVQSSKFELCHLVENKPRNQNSTAQIKISPIDIMPHPRINIRF